MKTLKEFTEFWASEWQHPKKLYDFLNEAIMLQNSKNHNASEERVTEDDITEAMHAHPDDDNYDFDWNLGFRAGARWALKRGTP